MTDEPTTPVSGQEADDAVTPAALASLGALEGDAAATEAEPVQEAPEARASDGCHLGVGRRKSAVARVRIRPGEGRFLVNGREVVEYFPSPQGQIHATAALTATKREKDYDILVRVQGGGPTGQAGAILMGAARALKNAEPSLEEILRREGHLTRDARMKERKKYGRRGARRSFQFSKR